MNAERPVYFDGSVNNNLADDVLLFFQDFASLLLCLFA